MKRFKKMLFWLAGSTVAVVLGLFLLVELTAPRADEVKLRYLITGEFFPAYKRVHGHYPTDLAELLAFAKKQPVPFYYEVVLARHPRLENVREIGGTYTAELHFDAFLGQTFKITFRDTK